YTVFIFFKLLDERVKDWYFIANPLPILSFTVTYLITVKIIGPKIMRNRKAFELRKAMIAYNTTMVITSLVMFIEMANLIEWGKYAFTCQKVDTSTADVPMRMCNIGWYFLVTKFIEYIDTIFFVLRKKENQVTTLHIIHHASVPISVWFGFKFAPGGNNALFPVMNSFVHVIMYLYYGLSAFGPKVQKYLWWKRYITSMQLIQFVILLIHGVHKYVNDCDFPKVFLWLNIGNAVIFFALFFDFYRTSYVKIDKKVKIDEMPATTSDAKCAPNKLKAVDVYSILYKTIAKNSFSKQLWSLTLFKFKSKLC
ncbi:elongation of very long chain fatty acids protein-like isoform X2, partial [Leptotrombidium deliense]